MQFPIMPWLDPVEQVEVVKALLGWELAKYSNQRNLPLKKGGTTDIYMNLRDARNHPDAITYIAKLFCDPIRRLGVKKFAEVPDAVSCFAGMMSIMLKMPYVTIREQPKEGRVAKATMIGDLQYGDFPAIMDDVVTDGTSKLELYWQIVAATGEHKIPLVVLVDRQQGWRKKFADAGAKLHVWPGMTLHDVRYHLVKTLGVMKRCDPNIEEKNPIIVALDGKSWEDILAIVDPLRTTGCILKVNDLLFEQGMGLIEKLSVYGRVMADFKWFDIKNTIENSANRLRQFAPWAVTVHASAGVDGVAAAVKAVEGTSTKVLAITVLTSFDNKVCDEVYHRLPLKQVKALAALAVRAGAHGFVCSPQEVRELRGLYPNLTFVTPGVRSLAADAQDQARVDTPANAIANGATHIVSGRQILGATDPVGEVKRLLTEELRINI